jgi:hypothetical protein
MAANRLELVHEQRIDKHEPFQPIRILGTFYGSGFVLIGSEIFQPIKTMEKRQNDEILSYLSSHVDTIIHGLEDNMISLFTMRGL